MKFSYTWLQEYFDTPLPSVADLSRLITMHAFEIDGTEPHGADTILDIKVLPNRSHDGFSYHGIAREVAALLDVTANIPEVHPKTDSSISTSDHLSLAIENSKLVPRAMKRYVEGVTIGESPEWLKTKLAAHGQRSINNVVDATNLTMLETGQPVHAFDYDKLKGAGEKGKVEISIRNAREGEVVTTLDAKPYTLDPDMLVISDSEKALDIAGVKGGSVSGIDANTTRIVLSVCNFDPINIRKTSKKLGLRTDASIRFEQGISPELTAIAMERLSALIEELAQGKVACDVVESYPNKKNRYVVGVSLSEINTALGTTCSQEEVEDYFKRLGFEYTYIQPLDQILKLAPTFVGIPYKLGASVLSDAPNLFDCSSFTASLFGFSGVMIPRISVDQYVFGTPVDAADIKAGDLVFANTGTEPIHRESKEFMKGTPVPEGVDHVGIYLGDGKVIHSSRHNEKGVDIQVLAESEAFKNIVGYRRIITSDEKRFVVTVSAPRIDIRIKEDLIEEIGRLKGLEAIPSTPLPFDGFVPAVNKSEYYKALIRRALVDTGFSEVSTYAFQKNGDIEVANPIADDKKYLRSSLVDGVTAALELNKKNKPLLGTDMIRLFEIGTVFAKGGEHQEIAIAAEKPAELDRAGAVLSEVPGVDIAWKKSGSVAVGSFTDAIEGLSTPDSYGDLPRLPNMTFAPISIYPFILRDIAVWVTDGDAESIPTITRTHGGLLVARIDLFDTFTKEGRTSYAYHIVFQSSEKTLSDVEVSEVMGKIEDEIRGKGWEVR
ncbi:MAG: C40 family peptidase [Candidatus Pacebacteria bacterium]|nr:C40 family peptidase [Candidatus Paceibacterota bacterium]